MINTKNAMGKIMGKPVSKTIVRDKISNNKRKCKVCGKVHKNMPFTDCYSEKTDGSLPDDLGSYYKKRYEK